MIGIVGLRLRKITFGICLCLKPAKLFRVAAAVRKAGKKWI